MYRLRELRKNRGLTQKDVALSISVSPQSYGYYENEINHPDPQTLIKLADFFECSVDYLLGREDDLGNVVINTGAAPSFDPAEEQLIKNYRRLNYHQQEAISLQAKIMADKNFEVIKK